MICIIIIKLNSTSVNPYDSTQELKHRCKEDTMTAFVHIDYPSQHPGVERAVQVAERLEQVTASFDGARGVATLLLAEIGRAHV